MAYGLSQGGEMNAYQQASSMFGDMNLAGKNIQQLTEEERLARKKKINAAGTNSAFPDAMAQMFGPNFSSLGTPRT